MNQDLLPADALTFEQDMFRDCSFLVEVKQIAFMFINVKNNAQNGFLFADEILIPMVTKLFENGQGAVPHKPSAADIRTFVYGPLVAGWSTEIRVPGLCASVALMQTDPDGKRIHFNSFWILRADLAHQLEKGYDCRQVDLCEELGYHITCAVIKLIREILHTLTPRCLDYEFDLYKKANTSMSVQQQERDKLARTPKWMGTKKLTTNSVLGDMGFAGEELLFGNGIHMYLDFFAKTTDTHQHFQAKGLHFMFRKDKEAAKVARSASVTSATSLATHADIIYTFQDMCFIDSDEMRLYVVRIRQAFAALRATPNRVTFEALRAALAVNRDLFQEAPSKSALEVTVKGIEFSRRKAAPAGMGIDVEYAYNEGNEEDSTQDECITRLVGGNTFKGTVDLAEPL